MTVPARPRAVCSIAVLLLATAVAAGAYAGFPLTITFDDPVGAGVSGDGLPYDHKTEGRVPVVEMDGVILLDTRRSTRTVCFDFDAAVVPGPGVSLAPADICAPVLLRTLIRPDNLRAADVPVGGALEFGMDVYWTGPAQSGGSFDYVLEYKRVEGNGVLIAHPDENTWTVENIMAAQVSVMRRGKGGGWSVVGQYQMPVRFTAVRAQ